MLCNPSLVIITNKSSISLSIIYYTLQGHNLEFLRGGGVAYNHSKNTQFQESPCLTTIFQNRPRDLHLTNPQLRKYETKHCIQGVQKILLDPFFLSTVFVCSSAKQTRENLSCDISYQTQGPENFLNPRIGRYFAINLYIYEQ